MGIVARTVTSHVGPVHNCPPALVAPDTCNHVLDGSSGPSEVFKVMGVNQSCEVLLPQRPVVNLISLRCFLKPPLPKRQELYW